MVSNYTGMHVQANKAIVGANAFAHEAGIHQDGMLKNASTFEIMTAESVGWSQSRLVLGKHSGRHALKARLEELGYTLETEALNLVFARFKDLADAKKNVTDADLEALMADELHKPQEFFKLDDIQITCGTMGMPTATAKMSNMDGEIFVHAAVGKGPVDACFQAVDAIVKCPNTLIEYSVHAVTRGDRRARRSDSADWHAGRKPFIWRLRRAQRYCRRQRESLHGGAQSDDRGAWAGRSAGRRRSRNGGD